MGWTDGETLINQLRLLQLADSALPVGSLSHSFGLECMTEEGHVAVPDLFAYIGDLLREGLLLDAVYCRSAHARATAGLTAGGLNQRLNALRVARESRTASLALGRRLLKLVLTLQPSAYLEAAADAENHFAVAFGLAGGALGFQASETVIAFVHQSVLNIISAAQRLLPLGQVEASRIAWDLKPAIAAAVQQSAAINVEDAVCFSHLPELASMRHPNLTTRLFIS